MDIILYILPVFLIVLLLPKYFMVLLAKCVDNALFREKIIDKEIRRKLYRNGVFADLIASFSMIMIGFIQNIIESPSYYFTGQPIKFCVNNNPSSNNGIADCGAIRLSDLPRVNSAFLSAECYARQSVNNILRTGNSILRGKSSRYSVLKYYR